MQPAAAWWTCGLAGAAAVLSQLSVIWRFYAFAGARPALTWAYLAGVVVTAIALFGSFRKLRPGAQVVWRSTTYTKT